MNVRVVIMKKGRHILRSEYGKGRFIYQSFSNSKSCFGDVEIDSHITFLADAGNGIAAEWEPKYGPIQVWRKCSKDWSGENCFGKSAGAREHWHFNFVEDDSMNWSQMAVGDEGLKQMLVNGDYDGIFNVLMRWAW